MFSLNFIKDENSKIMLTQIPCFTVHNGMREIPVYQQLHVR